MYIKTREELLGTVINTVPYGWTVVPDGQLLKDTDLFVSGGGLGPRGHLVPAKLQENQKSYTSSFFFGCSYIRPIEEESIYESAKYYYVLKDKKIVGIVDNPHVVGGPGVSVLEITSKDRISKIQELFKI